MEAIFHEQQEGSLCAQHCLNALLQGNYFTAVDLAELAQQLDETERQTMAEAGVQSDEYKRFIQQPSSNYDDSGFFSIQVIQNALWVWNLELVPYTSSHDIAEAAREKPTQQTAYICNFKEHWFTIRKLGNQWFNLNSLLTAPELVSDTFLALLLRQLQNDGYSIFVVVGSLPDCEADQLLGLMPAVQPIKPGLLSDESKEDKGQKSGSSRVSGDDALLKALDDSRKLQEESEEAQLEAALALSMQETPGTSGIAPPIDRTDQPSTSKVHSDFPSQEAPSPEELRKKRLAFLDKQGPSQEPSSAAADIVQHQSTDSLTEEEQLKIAIDFSLNKT